MAVDRINRHGEDLKIRNGASAQQGCREVVFYAREEIK